jgi:hypothetical protein
MTITNGILIRPDKKIEAFQNGYETYFPRNGKNGWKHKKVEIDPDSGKAMRPPVLTSDSTNR